MEEIKNWLEHIVGERPLGTASNDALLAYLNSFVKGLGYQVTALPLECLVWEKKVLFIFWKKNLRNKPQSFFKRLQRVCQTSGDS